MRLLLILLPFCITFALAVFLFFPLGITNAQQKAGKALEQTDRRRFSIEADVFQSVKNSVFTIFGDEGHGSCFLVDTSGLIVTNNHVVGSSRELSVQINESLRVEALRVVSMLSADIAILRVHPETVRSLTPLKLAPRRDNLAIEGERVIAVGSPLSQIRIVTSGIVSKIGERIVISDVNINPGNSGGPLINMDSEVIGINTFIDQAGSRGPGISGSISIWEALDALKDARNDQFHHLPSPAPLTVMPRDIFPLTALMSAVKARKDLELPVDDYRIVLGDFRVEVVTPPYQYFIEKAGELESAKRRLKREERANLSRDEKYNPFSDLTEWSRAIGLYSPVVMIRVAPKVSQEFLGPRYEFEEDLQDFFVTIDGIQPAEIRRKLAFVSLSPYLPGADLARVGELTFLPEIFKPSPTRWPLVEVHIVGLQDIADTIVAILPKAALRRIYLDFEPYFEQCDLAKARLAVSDSQALPGFAVPPYVGLGWEEFVAAMGREPDTTYSAKCGEESANPWNGLVCKYYRKEPDPRFGVSEKQRTPERRIIDTYIFYDDGRNRRLNHWSLGGDMVSEWKDSR